jgi:hypothetical protein
MIVQKLSSIRSVLRSASARSLDFGDILPLKENKTVRERTKIVEMDRCTSYDSHEATRRHCVSATEISIWEIPD